MTPSLYVETHGCQMNEADSADVQRRAAAAGYALVERPEDAAVLVLTTCTVRDNAEQRAYGRIQQWKALKRADPRVRIVVTGCLAEQDRDRMRTIVPHVDEVFGTRELARLGETLASWAPELADAEDDDATLEARRLLAPLGGVGEGIAGPYDALRAFVNVQRGCSYYCTFCIVPHVRGRFDHRPMPEILAEIRGAVARGAREITLVGQTVNAYREPASGADFADLLVEAAALSGVERLTFVTSHPNDLSEKLARTAAAIPALNPRLHVALQSASNPVLRRMNRKYTIEAFDERLAMWRAHNPGWAITTDLMVGFPGETEADAQATIDYAVRFGFSQAFMFVYSRRRGTPADRWEQVDPEAAQARFVRLAAAVDAGVLAYHRRRIGTVVRALVTGPSRRDPGVLAAKTLDHVTVHAPLHEDAPDLARPWIDVRVETASVGGVGGTAVGRAAAWDAPAEPLAPAVISLL